MDFLTKSIKAQLNNGDANKSNLSAKDKYVIIIGGGDTGTDCVATATRQGARSIVNFELMPQAPSRRSYDNPWPQFPLILRLDYGHEEAVLAFGSDPRSYCVMTKSFITNSRGELTGVRTVEVDINNNFTEISNTQKEWRADMVLLSMGFISPEHYLSDIADISLDNNNNYKAQYGDYQTNQSNIFSAGDCRRGQSLIVWAIHEGRGVAERIDKYLESA